MEQAFARVWGDEDTHKTPLTRRMLRSVFIALAETGHTLADAAHLLDYEARGFRQELIDAIAHPQAKQDLEHVNRLSKDRNGLAEFNATVLGPTNRVVEFLACEAMRLMFSTTRAKDDRTIDILDIINRGHILLVDLEHGTRVDEAATDLLGKIILRYFFTLLSG